MKNINGEEVRLTSEGYEKLKEELLELKKRYDENELAMSQSFQSAAGDGAHDNGEFEALQKEEKLLVAQMNQLSRRMEMANIIDIPTLSDEQVNINDRVLLRMTYSADDIEEGEYKLVGTDGNSQINEISINSPIGKAIFQRKIGEESPFRVKEATYKVKILEKIRKNG